MNGDSLLRWIFLWGIGILNLLIDKKFNLVVGILCISLGTIELYEATHK